MNIFQRGDRILVIGGTGFIGKHLARKCLEYTPYVTCLGFSGNTDKTALVDNIEFIKCDVTERKQLLSALNNKHRVKGKSSMKLQMEFSHIKKAFGGRHVWARRFFVASSGNVTDEVTM
jgi:dTDP-D-glucose 4,6-dehydratase